MVELGNVIFQTIFDYVVIWVKQQDKAEQRTPPWFGLGAFQGGERQLQPDHAREREIGSHWAKVPPVPLAVTGQSERPGPLFLGIFK